MTEDERLRRLWASADGTVRISDEPAGFFGRDVLSGLVGHLAAAAVRPRTDRAWGPGILGCTMWMDDPELISVLHRMANVCIVVTKQSANRYKKSDTEALRALAAAQGLAHAAYPELADLAVSRAGEPLVVGPYTGDWREGTVIEGVREVGYRRSGGTVVPIVHAKIALLGQMMWHDEHPLGFAEDILYFVPERLWIGSANFTRTSRSSLEMGLWTAEPSMMQAARKFLLSLIAMSEPLGSGPNIPEPQLQQVTYDDAAFSQYLADNPEEFVEPDLEGGSDLDT
jgi:hypothetical protein